MEPVRLTPLLAASSLGPMAALLAGGALLRQLPRATPDTPASQLALQQRLDPNPTRRREAALLLAGGASQAPARRSRLLAGQGWGQGPLAAVALKQQALDAAALGQPQRAKALWHLLQRRLPNEPASADALYALGQHQPDRRRHLLRRWPAHPAALAAALQQAGPGGALHLARWGARWPGAQQRISNTCERGALGPDQRQQLAAALAEIGADAAARRCLGAVPPLPATALLLAGSDPSTLQALIEQHPASPAADAALRQLADDPSPAAAAALAKLPQRWQAHPAAAARRALDAANPDQALGVLRRWPQDPASWELQWQRARAAALAGRWPEVGQLLAAGGTPLERSMPAALQARRRFWLGLSHWQQRQPEQARREWRQLLLLHPGGYYGWRAASRLGLAHEPLQGQPALPPNRWSPLASGDGRVDALWRLGQPLEAWEAWRTTRGGQTPRGSRALQAEGRLREAIGDGWTGLGQQELAALRLQAGQCRLQQLIDTNLYRPRQLEPLAAAARNEAVPLNLLLGVAKQESRFQSRVGSVVGATGLLQLMPATAAELAGRRLTTNDLHDPGVNAELGGRYLRQLLERWGGEPLLAVASYNAGPNAVAAWRPAQLQPIPELWVEAIPYPETRHYVKVVLGNTWSFAAPRRPLCP